MKNKIIVIGGGGHAKVLISVIKKDINYEIVGYLDMYDHGNILGIKYLGNDNSLKQLLKKGVKNAVLGIGQINLTEKRYDVVQVIKRMGFNFPYIISKDAIINDEVSIKEGTQIFDGCVINSGTKIGKFNIINTNSTIEHDCVVGDYCHIATGAVLSGGVKLGNFSMIGSNAVIIQYKSIKSRCMIGSGSVVNKDITEGGVYVGVPVRKVN